MKEQIGKRIASFWKGVLSKKEEQSLLEDIRVNESEIQEDLQRVFGADPKEDERLSEEAYQKLLDKIYDRMDAPVHMERPAARLRNWSIAAAMLLAVSLGLYTFVSQEERLVHHAHRTASTSNDTLKLVNDLQHDQQAVLSDGSTVILSSGSSLSYTKTYGVSNRTLHLKGRGRFKVAHDTTRPFVVWANGYTTTALGTDFTVDTRQDDRLDIYLQSGKIVVEATPAAKLSMEKKYLLPGDNLQILTEVGEVIMSNPQQRSLPIKKTVPAQRAAVEEVMSFQDTPLLAVFDSIGRKKEVRISSNADELAGLTFTGEFKSSESVTSIIGIVCQMNGLHFTETTDGGIIVSKEVEPLPSPLKEQSNKTNK
ncbi:FecR family protein [Sphingobacterium bambusae]|uniref:FecR family protein n=1 Tax=Sphingobacterium bambusae TaxID=662858 RepID=A0ABW6BH17_9SPHI|nr:FecR domain-containing protein [Sphingobacterium bambusae]WPL47507.1 FecR domain-containing protein [Sphingobacterium bambusae]